MSADALLDAFAEQIEPYPFGNGHPRFWGWVNPPPTVMGIFADALAAAMNPSVAGGNHASVYVERQVIAWFRQMLGFPIESMGLLVSGGSMATLTGLAVARHVKTGGMVRQKGMQGLNKRLTVYTGTEGHSCIRKAVEMLGIGGDHLRLIPCDEAFQMRVPELEEAIQRDIEAGFQPMAVAASAGTVNTGAIDPLDEIADLCARYKLWMHVDGAYGLPAILSRQYGAALTPIQRADSVAMDPHKWLSVPVEAGLALVRDGAAMRDAFSFVPPYLRTDNDPHGVGGPVWLSEYGFQQTRGFRALKVWMALRYHGLSGYAACISQHIALAEYLADRVRETPELEMLAPQRLSIVCFRFAPPSLQGEETRLDALNRALLREMQLGGEVFVSGTVLNGKFALRACIINSYSRREDMDLLVKVTCALGRKLVA